MGKTLFDNLIKAHSVDLDTILNVLQSIEVDLELPRGFVAKIKKLSLFTNGNLSAVGNIDVQAALIRDPDDITTLVFPDNTVQHDVIASLEFNAQKGTVTTGSIGSLMGRHIVDLTFDEGEDLITARNMRFNAIGSSGAISLGSISAVIRYTLEEVKDADILDLLDIL